MTLRYKEQFQDVNVEHYVKVTSALYVKLTQLGTDNILIGRRIDV